MFSLIFLLVTFSNYILVDSQNLRIVFGSDATKRFTYMASLQLEDVDGLIFHICGASILNQNYLLTAAHCVEIFKVTELSILIGTNDLNKNGTRYALDSVTIHPDYDSLAIKNDIALMKVATPMIFNDLIGPIILNKKEVGVGVTVKLTGWGYKYIIRAGRANTLQEVDMETIPCPAGETDICASKGFKGACGVNFYLIPLKRNNIR